MESTSKHVILDDYVLERELGSGANARVYLGYHKKNPDEKFAIKLVNTESSNDYNTNVEAIVSEAKILMNFNHYNIIKIFDLKPDGVLAVRGNKLSPPIPYCVMQCAERGVLIFYLMSGGLLEEPMARFYFRQLVDGLSYIHGKGIVHRDLKPDNLLLGSNYELLIADFGHSTGTQGKKGDGKLSTRLGPPIYNAPEITTCVTYQGQPVDVFMAGVVLFICLTANTPFRDGANKQDPFYKNFMAQNPQAFWSLHESRLKHVTFSKDLKDLLSAILNCDPSKRPTLEEILNSTWMKGKSASAEEAKAEMDHRFQAEEKKKEMAAQKAAQRKRAGGQTAGGSYGEHHRDIVVEKGGIISYLNKKEKAEIAQQVRDIKFDTEPPLATDNGSTFFNNYYSSFSPVELLKAAAVVANNMCEKVNLKVDLYEVSYSLL
jgi:serine/threonine protein kinase